MGFRDVLAFNLAMLAKQAWRLIHNNQSLFYRVYKARYFPNCSFMLAELGPNPSFVWRSLLAARDVIREGSTWRVGDGQNIGVLLDKWLQNKSVFLNELDDQMRVSNLINHDTRQWDRGELVATFTQSTCAEILALLLNHLDSQDNLIWTANKTQQFSIKSTYRIALKLKSGDWVEHSSTRQHGATWGRTWKLNVPPKVRNFIWRACSNCPPTRNNLWRGKVRIEAMCDICQQEQETTSHVLWTCPFAWNVWAFMRGRVQKCSNEVDNFFLLFKKMQTALEANDLDRWAVTAWSIWNARNKYYFDHV